MGVPIQSVSCLCENFTWTEPVFWKKSYKLRYLQRHLDKSHKLMNLGVGKYGEKKKHRQNPGRTHASPQARLSKLFLLSTSFHLRNSFTQPWCGYISRWAQQTFTDNKSWSEFFRSILCYISDFTIYQRTKQIYIVMGYLCLFSFTLKN